VSTNGVRVSSTSNFQPPSVLRHKGLADWQRASAMNLRTGNAVNLRAIGRAWPRRTNLRRSPIAVIIDRFAGDRQLFWAYGRYNYLLDDMQDNLEKP
jgi:hypothetical protein